MLEHIKTEEDIALLFEEITMKLKDSSKPHSFVGIFELGEFQERYGELWEAQDTFAVVLKERVHSYIEEVIRASDGTSWTPETELKHQISNLSIKTASGDTMSEDRIKSYYGSSERIKIKISLSAKSLVKSILGNSLMNDDTFFMFIQWNQLETETDICVLPLKTTAENLMSTGHL